MTLFDFVRKHLNMASFAAVLAATFLTFVPTFQFGFVWDDAMQIVDNPRVHSWTFVPSYFTQHLWAHDPFATRQYYRPLFLLALRCCDAVFGNSAMGWHVVLVLMHLLTCILVYRFVSELRGVKAGLIVMAIFALHPVHVEVVSWISAIGESMMTAALLGTAILARHSNRLPWAVILYFCALLCKETAIVWPVILFVALYDGFEPTLKRVLPFLATAAVYLIIRVTVLGHLSVTQPRSTSVWLLPTVMATYFYHLVWPVHLSPFRDIEPSRLAAACLLILVAALAFLASRGRYLALAVTLLVVPLLPLLGVSMFRTGALVQDRYLYLPSVGAAMLLGILLEKIPGPAVLALLTLMACGCLREEQPWRNNLQLYTRGLENAPRDQLLRINLAREYVQLDRMQDVIQLMVPLLSEPQESAYSEQHALLILASAYERTNHPKQALYCLTVAEQIHPLPEIEARINRVRMAFAPMDTGE